MTSLFNLFQNISKLIEAESIFNQNFKDSLLYPPSDYNINENSLFLDIGSGFGKPVFHSALQIGCESKGIEVVPARVEFCIDFFYEFLNEKNFFGDLNINSNISNNKNNSNNSIDPNNSTSLGKKNIKTEGEISDNEVSSSNVISSNYSNDSSTNRILNNQINPINTKLIKNNLIENLSAHTNNCFNIQKLSSTDSNIETIDVNFEKIYNLNELNGNPYNDIIKDNNKSNLFLELTINQEIIYDENFLQMVNDNNKIYKPILFEENLNFSDLNLFSNSNSSCLFFGKYFKLENISVAITPIDDYIYSNLEKIIINTIYVDSEEREMAKNLRLGQIEKLRKFSEIVEKIENYHILDFILYVNSIFNGKRSLLEMKSVNQNHRNEKFIQEEKSQFNILNPNNNSKSKNAKKPTQKKKDLYDELKEQLIKKENCLRKNNDNNDASSENLEDTNILKQVLVELKFNPPQDNWYLLTSFQALDATKLNNYSNENKKHFTHIYSYNKLMSKECRSKIAKILNKTKYKVLAWYSNPKQTKKAGLKNFSFICKFPMQSTSTEKFHVYVYIKTK